MSRKNWHNEKIFLRLVNNKTDRTYWDNILELRSRPTRETFQQCVKFLESTDARKRIVAVNIMAQLGITPRPFKEETIQLLFKLLENETDEKVICSTLIALGHNNEEFKMNEASILSKYVDHQNSQVRYSLVFALLSVDNNVAIDTLINLSTDSDSATRDWATFGLGNQLERNNKKIREALWKRVNDHYQNAKLEAILGLAKRGDNRVNDIIQRELEEGEYAVILFEAIEELNNDVFLPQLEKNLVIAKTDEGIKEEWIKDLENCIRKLKTNQTNSSVHPEN